MAGEKPCACEWTATIGCTGNKRADQQRYDRMHRRVHRQQAGRSATIRNNGRKWADRWTKGVDRAQPGSSVRISVDFVQSHGQPEDVSSMWLDPTKSDVGAAERHGQGSG